MTDEQKPAADPAAEPEPEPTKPAPAAPPTDASESGSGSGRDETDEDGFLGDELRDAARFVTIQHFHGEVLANESTFGMSGTKGGPSGATGPLRPEEVREALRRYRKPISFGPAYELLRQHRLVVLCGPDGIGKYAGALALLQTVAPPDTVPTNLSPALTFPELAGLKFRNPGGYLVRDQLRDGTSVAVQQFEVHRLTSALRERSYLVITTDLGARPRGHLANLMVDWLAPDLGELFTDCLADLPDGVRQGDGFEQIRRHVAGLTSPREVVRVARLLADGPEQALATLEQSERSRVGEWFERDPGADEVLGAAALVFLDGALEPDYERRLARLKTLYRAEVGAILPSRPAEQVGTDGSDRPMRQSRRRVADCLTVVTGQSGSDPEHAGGRRVTFAAPEMRELVLRELYERYGYELWEPLRKWLHELATQPPSWLHVRLGLGMALYSQLAFTEVDALFLDNWSAGGMSERLAAACTLNWIGQDGTYGAAALGITKRWANNAGPRRAATAASVLGGALGLRYPSDALRWLWQLALRGHGVSKVACVALGLLFAESTNDPAAARRVLNFLRERLREATQPGKEQRRRRATFDVVLSILSARMPQTDEPAAALVLRANEANAARLGLLWAVVLGSGPHRREACISLLRTLERFSGDPEALPAVGRFGAAVQSVLPPEQWERLEESLEREATLHHKGDSALFAAVLAALRGSVRHRLRHAINGSTR